MMYRTAFFCGLFCILVAVLAQNTHAAERRDFNAYPPDVVKHLARVNSVGQRHYAYREDYPGGQAQWQTEARAELVRLLGLEKIAAQDKGFTPRAELGAAEDLGEFTRQLASLETEPAVQVPFYLLKPKGEGPFPVGIFPHGHDARGHRTSAGIYEDAMHRMKSLAEDRDVAVQAAKRGFLAIAPAVRGLSVDGVPDLYERHGGRTCRSHLVHCLLAGRTAMGERVWDMQRFLDWALALPEADTGRVLMMGNSGGGMVTLYAAACDPRVTVAVPSCSFSMLTSPAGYIYHCDCNLVPGLLGWGGLSDVAGLIAPRHLLTVNGRKDGLHTGEDIDRAAARVHTIYKATGVPSRFEARWGEEGHRFYSALMWPFIDEAIGR